MSRRQLPGAGEVFLDHVAHFVPDLEAASADLERLGFTLTARTPQMNAASGGSLVPAGTANRCVMLEEGYLEFLTPISDTPLAGRMRAQIDRYTGLHLICFSDADPEAARARLEAAGFGPEAPVRLRRTIEALDGREEELRFSIVRVPPGEMAEGRIQYVTHHTPGLLWQQRWTQHANGARALREVVIVVEDAAEAAARFAAFADRTLSRSEGGRSVRLDRGRVLLLEEAAWRRALPTIRVPSLPWIAGYLLEVADLEASAADLAARGITFQRDSAFLALALPPTVGGVLVLSADPAFWLVA